jgi:bifunctional non-homologous end joining protein LigD
VALSVDDFRPMQAAESPVKAFTDPDWIFEIKFDGYRTLAGVEPPKFGGSASKLEARVQLRTRTGKDCTRWYPEVAEVLSTLPGGPHVLDGEACVLDDIGRADFNRLQDRARRRCWYKDCDPVTLCLFDILVHDGRNVTGLPLVERKALLKKLLARAPKRSLLYVGDFPADAGLFPQVVLALKLEGFVAKRKDSIYLPGERTFAWRKVKRPGWQEGRRWRA